MQLFSPRWNLIVKLLILLGICLVISLPWLIYELGQSPWLTGLGATRKQEVPFDHQIHAGDLGMDCRYCHTSVNKGSFAGMPTKESCMSCHSMVGKDLPLLKPLYDKVDSGEPIEWVRTNDLPDFVFFDHSMHTKDGMDCAMCHGNVTKMKATRKTETLLMTWCLDCHRDPEGFANLEVEMDMSCSICHQ